MKLDSVTILPFYNSYDNDIVEEFYNKVFEFATHYDRASDYFDSKILSLYCRGMANIYKKSPSDKRAGCYRCSLSPVTSAL